MNTIKMVALAILIIGSSFLFSAVLEKWLTSLYGQSLGMVTFVMLFILIAAALIVLYMYLHGRK